MERLLSGDDPKYKRLITADNKLLDIVHDSAKPIEELKNKFSPQELNEFLTKQEELS